MIIKGGSRGAPSQLGRHLARTDTNECVRVLELQSGRTSPEAAFEDWQTIAEGTRGRKGLYHANIDPDPKYPMTEAQFMRAADVLEAELGLTGQPRCVVLHEKEGRTHIHVVWQRTDIDRMMLVSDSKNYLAHERASQQLEREFGHEHVPGKHAKRDREAQPDMPSAEVSHDEWQQQERGGLGHGERKAQVTALYQSADSGPAFKAALEDAGYVLARGDRRDFVIMDAEGRAHSLGRQLPGVKAAELRAFMADVDPSLLPGVKEARAALREQSRQQEAPAPEDARKTAMLEALAIRQAQEREAQERRFAAEIAALQKAQVHELNRETEQFVAAWVKKDMAAPKEPGAMERLARSLREAVSGDARQQRQDAEARRAAEADEKFKEASRALADELSAKRQQEMTALTEKQDRERRELAQSQDAERERRIADEQRGRELQRQMEEREREAQTRSRDGPDRGGGRAR